MASSASLDAFSFPTLPCADIAAIQCYSFPRAARFLRKDGSKALRPVGTRRALFFFPVPAVFLTTLAALRNIPWTARASDAGAGIPGASFSLHDQMLA
jgi:hypothetical protein